MQPVLWFLYMLNTEHYSMNNGEFYMCCCIIEQAEGGQEDKEQKGGYRAGRRT